MMKFFNLSPSLLVTMFLLSFSSCSDDNNLEYESNNNNDTVVYCQFKIVQSGEEITKADSVEETDDKDNGEKNEYTINKVDLYFFSALEGQTAGSSGKFLAKASVDSVDVSEDPSGIMTSLATVKVSGISSGTYRVYAIANLAETILLNTNTTEADFLKSVQNVAPYNKGLISAADLDPKTKTGFMMASRSVGSATDVTSSTPWTTVKIEDDNRENNPTKFTIEMERVMAKLTVLAGEDSGTGVGKNKYSIPHKSVSPYATVEIDGYEVVNLRKDFFVFRHTASAFTYNSDVTYGFGRIETSTESGAQIYVMDPQTVNKSIDNSKKINADNYISWYVNPAESPEATYTSMPTTDDSPKTMGYCLENTTHQEAQLNGYSTGIIFRGKITPTSIYVEGSDDPVTVPTEIENIVNAENSKIYFWTYGNTFYASLEAFKKQHATIPIDENDLQKSGIKTISNGYCYYPYWIKHFTQKEVMAPMEFGIVRNNVYVMQINGILGIGEEGGGVDPNTPDESEEVYLMMTMNIRPWYVRSNEGIIL